MANLPRDPWVDVKTRHGLPADEIISSLQKEIRRGNTENAALIAYEMATTSPQMEAYLWKRLLVISVEDVGWGDLQAPVLLNSLYQMVKELDRTDGERLLYAVHAVRYLCECKKDRSSDEMVNWIIREVEAGNALPTIPEYAVDMHTARGQKMGRGVQHFLEEGARVAPELPDRDLTYREKLLKVIEKNG
jgi:replication-associated recombination protein RarA